MMFILYVNRAYGMNDPSCPRTGRWRWSACDVRELIQRPAHCTRPNCDVLAFFRR